MTRPPVVCASSKQNSDSSGVKFETIIKCTHFPSRRFVTNSPFIGDGSARHLKKCGPGRTRSHRVARLGRRSVEVAVSGVDLSVYCLRNPEVHGQFRTRAMRLARTAGLFLLALQLPLLLGVLLRRMFLSLGIPDGCDRGESQSGN